MWAGGCDRRGELRQNAGGGLGFVALREILEGGAVTRAERWLFGGVDFFEAGLLINGDDIA